jgi:thioredoxin reductase
MYDVIIIGGSFAGLSAAMYLARGRHTVAVLDTGTPRNRFSPKSHGFFGQDGSVPQNMLSLARTQLSNYPTVHMLDDEAVSASGSHNAFCVTLGSGDAITARRLVIASGVQDILPSIDGLAERWGKSVLHCPYCHGYEFAGQRLGVLYNDAGSVHHARLIANWGPTTLFTNGIELPDKNAAQSLAELNINVSREPIRSLIGDGDSLNHIETTEGSRIGLDALYVAPSTQLRGVIGDMLGCNKREVPGGQVLIVDERMMTTVCGIYAAGDAASVPSMVARAVSDGSLAGAMVSQSLIFET